MDIDEENRAGHCEKRKQTRCLVSDDGLGMPNGHTDLMAKQVEQHCPSTS